MSRLILAALVFAGCTSDDLCHDAYGAPKTIYNCDAATTERIFIECLDRARYMGGPSIVGNASDDVVKACHSAADSIGCTRIPLCIDGGLR